MSISYDKADQKPESRYFLLFGEEGVWQEVTAESYVAAEAANGLGSNPVADFTADTMRGTVTTDGSRPKDVKKAYVAEPMVRRASEKSDASYRLIFPEGSYSVLSVGQDSGPDFGPVTVILSPEQYHRFTKAQVPHAVEKIAGDLEEKAKGAHPLKEVLLGGLAEGLRKAAQDLRDGTPAKKRPSIQDLRDLLKG